MPQAKKTLYEILGVGPDANSIDLGLAYEKRHAELQRAMPQDPSAMALLHQAYEVLRDPAQRAAYDASLVTARERAAASEQSAPDLALQADPPPPRRIPWAAFAAAGVLIIVVLYYALRPERIDDAAAEAKLETAVVETKPAEPAPPPVLSAVEILKNASAAAGQLVSVEMSGTATPIGLAVAVEPGTLVTTCSGIQAGRKLIVMLGAEPRPADLAVTDEALNLCKLTVAGARPLPLAPREARAGDTVYVLGANPAGELAMTEGTVRGLAGNPPSQVLDISVPIAPKGSGGPVFDVNGRIVGIALTPHRYDPKANVVLPASWIPQVRSRGRSQ